MIEILLLFYLCVSNVIIKTMDACEAVEKELQRVITKFNGVHEHAKRMLGDVTKNFEDLKSSIAEGELQTVHIFN